MAVNAASPFFSVVIPTFRRPTLLGEAIDSVLGQTWRDLELIVVDDDPQNSAYSVVSAYDDGRISYVANDRARGGSGTRNAGIFRARGRWVAFLDDDDVWLPEKLAKQHELISNEDEDLGIVYAGSAIYDFERGEIISKRRCEKAGWLSRDLLERNWLGGFFSVVIRRDLLLAVGGLDERFPALQDLDLFVRAARLGKVGFVDDTLVLVRKGNTDRITRDARKKLVAGKLFLEKYRNDMSGHPRLMHRAAANIFTFGLAAGDIRAVMTSLPWMLAGVFVDPASIREVASRLLRQRMYDSHKRRLAASQSGDGAHGNRST